MSSAHAKAQQLVDKEQAILDRMLEADAYKAAVEAREALPLGLSVAQQKVLDTVEKQQSRVIRLQSQAESLENPTISPGASGASKSSSPPDPIKYQLPGHNSSFTSAKDGQVNQSAKSQHEQLCLMAQPLLGGVKRALEDTTDEEPAAALKKKIMPIMAEGKKLFHEQAKFLIWAGKHGFPFAMHARGCGEWEGLTAEDDKQFHQAMASWNTRGKERFQGSGAASLAPARSQPAAPNPAAAPMLQMLPNGTYTLGGLPVQFAAPAATQVPGMSQVSVASKPAASGGQGVGKGASSEGCYRCGASGHFARACPHRGTA